MSDASEDFRQMLVAVHRRRERKTIAWNPGITDLPAADPPRPHRPPQGTRHNAASLDTGETRLRAEIDAGRGEGAGWHRWT